MNTEKVRLNITLPVELVRELTEMTEPRKRSQFIADSVAFRIKQFKDEKRDALLTEGYQAEKEEAIKITKEFEGLDVHGWDDY